MKPTALFLAVLATIFSNRAMGQAPIFTCDSVAGSLSSHVFTAARVFNFTNIWSMQGTIQFNPNEISYDTVLQLGLPGMSLTDFDTTQASNGILTYVWDAPILPITRPDSSIIFGIEFTVLSAGGSPVCFVDSPMHLEVQNSINVINASYVCGHVAYAGGVACMNNGDCDDGNACNGVETCDTVLGCKAGTPLSCDDGDVCNGTETCNALSGCRAGTPLDCSDTDACNYEHCNATTGCYYTARNCNDTNPCTDDYCDSLTGCFSLPRSCDDANPCTRDSCSTILGCLHGLPDCDDSDACTSDGCDSQTGVCLNTPVDCDDNDLCTSDGCVPATGCVNAANPPCSDNDRCTDDNCNAATGCVYTPISPCDDGDACTTDGCDSTSGCVYTPVICDDGLSCTADSCVNGQCAFTHLAAAPEICIVGIDSASGKNIIVWEKPQSSVIDSYFIYKETIEANEYFIIGSKAYGNFSTFIDQQSVPERSSNKYKLGFKDVCGQIIEGTTYHKTIHLTINRGMDSSWNLIWNHYEGFTFGTYYIYRGTSPSNLEVLNLVASSNNSYSDLNPPTSGTLYYQIEIINPNPCNPSARMGSYSASRSNIANTSSTGTEETESIKLLKMYPNPFGTAITIEMPNLADGPFEIIITDVAGRKSLNQRGINTATFVVNRNTCTQGLYYIELRGTKNIYRGKIIAY